MDAVEPCVGRDPLCPCQDGLACHYKAVGDSPAWLLPEPQDDKIRRQLRTKHEMRVAHAMCQSQALGLLFAGLRPKNQR
jgi:hypothetical protein